MNIKVGEVVEVRGTKITIRMFESSNKETHFFKGEKYKGVSIREYIWIEHGFREIVCVVEGEYLDEKNFQKDGNQTNYIRKIDAKPIGYFEGGKFHEGIKFLPMIKDVASLMPESKLTAIFSEASEGSFIIGKTLKDDFPISLPWAKIFNSHIGIFGNTGSGKSNTLAKIYTVLFQEKSRDIGDKSKFIVLDFNGEYTRNQLVPSEQKKVLKLNTAGDDGDKFVLSEPEFWDSETLSILFQATTNTQRPFLNRVTQGREKFADNADSFSNYLKSTFRSVFSAAEPKGETLNLLRNITRILEFKDLLDLLKEITWNGNTRSFSTTSTGGTVYFNADGAGYSQFLSQAVDEIQVGNLDFFDELVVRAHLQLTRDLIYGAVQFEHIQPLMKRMDSSMPSLRRIITTAAHMPELPLVSVISLRRCNQEMKKVVPLLIAKHFYHQHKNQVATPPDKTMHLIIDEAHNVLSQQSAREAESWKDYRLELFEEIIKEGRKFGMYITLASQRPADISPTIVSQIHNFFIHRLVNDRDLFLLDNTISTLDALSRNMIPNLSQGSCVVTGTSFDLPMLLQIDRLDDDLQPDSSDVPLQDLWVQV